MMTGMTDQPGSPAPADSDVGLDLLVWDAPNIDMTLAQVIGARPSSDSRPRFDALGRWFVRSAGQRDVEACVFANVPPQNAVNMRGWVETLRAFGFAVFARPKLQPSDDVDDAMLAHIEQRAAERRLERVVVASGDGRNFRQPLEELADAGVEVVVLSFSEIAGYAQESDRIQFIDLEDVEGVFTFPLNRNRLDALPPEGAWLVPTGSLRDL
jgi:uncharacterized protein